MSAAAIILAAGRGTRMGPTTDKVFVEVAGRPVLAWTLLAFERASTIDLIVVATRLDCLDRVAENLALVSFQFYGLALEASARATAGELHNATLLATTALGAVETLQGCEYGLDVRVLCTKALTMAGSPEAPLARRRATAHAAALMQTIRDPRLRVLFAKRPFVQLLLSTGGGSPSENARA